MLVLFLISVLFFVGCDFKKNRHKAAVVVGGSLVPVAGGGDGGGGGPGTPPTVYSLWLAPGRLSGGPGGAARRYYQEQQQPAIYAATSVVDGRPQLTLSHLRSMLSVPPAADGGSGGGGEVSFAVAERMLRDGRPVAAVPLADWLAERGVPAQWRGQRHGPADQQTRLLVALDTGALAVFRPGSPGLAELGGCAMLRVSALVQCPPIVPFDGRRGLPADNRLARLGRPTGAGTRLDLSRWPELRQPGSLQWLIHDDDVDRKQQHSVAAGFQSAGSEAWRAAWKLAWFLVGTYDCGLKHVLVDSRGVTWAVDVGKTMRTWAQWDYGAFPWLRWCPAGGGGGGGGDAPSLSSPPSSARLLTTRARLTVQRARQFAAESGGGAAATGGPSVPAAVPFAELMDNASLPRHVLPAVIGGDSDDPFHSAPSRPGWALAPFRQQPVFQAVQLGQRRRLLADQFAVAANASSLSSFFYPWLSTPQCHKAVAAAETKVLLGRICSKNYLLINWHNELWARPKCEERQLAPMCWRPPPDLHQYGQLARHVLTDFVPILADATHTLHALFVLAEAHVDQERAAGFLDRLRQAINHAIVA